MEKRLSAIRMAMAGLRLGSWKHWSGLS